MAYAGVLQQRRRELHARVVDAIESLHPDRLSEQVERLAYHAGRAELWTKAITYLRDAAVRAANRSAYGESLASFEEALRALGHLPESPAAQAQAIDLRLDSRVVLAPLGQYDRILHYMQEAEALARALGDRRRLGLVLADMGARLRNVGEHRRALDASRQALAIAGELDAADLRQEASYRMAQAHFALGDLGSATSIFLETVRGFEGGRGHAGALPSFFRAWPHAWLGVLLAHLGRFEQALRHADESMRIAAGANHPHTLVESHAALGAVNLDRGDLDTARRVFEGGVALFRHGGPRDMNLLSGLGYVHALSGRLAEALPLLEEAARSGGSISAMGSGLAVRVSRLAEAYLWAGRADEARTCARNAVELATKHHERANEAIALRVLAHVGTLGTSTEATDAETHYTDSLVLARELGMRPLVAHCHVGLGVLSRRLGTRPDHARRHLTTALGLYREMDMRFWPEQVEAEIRTR